MLDPFDLLASNIPMDLLVEVKQEVRDKPLTGEIIVRDALRTSLTFWKAACYSSSHQNAAFYLTAYGMARGAQPRQV